MQRIAFVLAGGGASGAWQCGALKAVLESGIRPNFVTANSVGALNAVSLSYAGIEELETLWLSIKSRSDIFRQTSPSFLRMLFGARSLYDSSPLEKKIARIMADRMPRFPVTVNSVSLKTGKIKRTTSGELGFQKQVLASASLPIITNPVDGEWVDGGVRENVPVREAIRRGATDVYMFINSPKDIKEPMPKLHNIKNIKQVAERTINIMLDEGYWEDVEICELWSQHGKISEVNIKVIAPPMEIMGVMDFDKVKIKDAIAQGYNWAKHLLNEWSAKESGQP